MDNYICTVCHYVYEPADNNNVAFEDLPDDYVCPLWVWVKICLKNSSNYL